MPDTAPSTEAPLKLDPIVPLRGRYASKEMKDIVGKPDDNDYRYLASDRMREVFCEEAKYRGWRDVWFALAFSQHSLGLDTIKPEHLAAMQKVLYKIDFAAAAAYEKKLKHDVMAYLREFKDRLKEHSPGSEKVPHLGATSCEITDNEELTSMRNGLSVLIEKARELESKTGNRYVRDAIDELEYRWESLRARGAKGTTGTQASFLELFGGDHHKVTSLDDLFAERLGFTESYVVTGQTYPRIVDYQVLSSLAFLGQALTSIPGTEFVPSGTYEGFALELSKKAMQAANMASCQWLERSLDDSSERRIIVSEAFYLADVMLDLAIVRGRSKELGNAQGMNERDSKALTLLRSKTASLIDMIYSIAAAHRDTLCTGYTHGQFAQPTTYGKRLSIWDYQFVLALEDMESLHDRRSNHPFSLGYLMNTRLSQLGVAMAKAAMDVRILQHDLEVNEPFGISQKGSSAMPYKKNPMACERANGLARNLIAYSAGTMADEYSLLNADALLELGLKIFSGDTDVQKGFTIHPQRAMSTLMQFMPFLAAENILMGAVKAGRDRDEAHEAIRLCSLAARDRIDTGRQNNMLDLLAEAGFEVDLRREAEYLNPATHVGRAREQVDEFGTKVVAGIKKRYEKSLGRKSGVQV